MSHTHRFIPHLLIAALVAVAAGAWSPIAAAQVTTTTVTRTTSPYIQQFYVDSADQLAPGSRVTFTVEGTPYGNASVRIGGINRRIPLREVETGVYEGSYIVRSGDVITTTTGATATLSRRGRTVTTALNDSLGTTVVATLPSTPATTITRVLAIDRFNVTPIDRIEPGAEIVVAMDATPGGTATFSIPGAASSIPMREVRSGHYEGTYTVRRSDSIASNAAIAGNLVVGGRTLRTTLNQPLTLASTGAPSVLNVTPANGATVSSVDPTLVAGTFDNPVDPASVTLLVGGRDVTRSSIINANSFSYRADLVPGTYTASVSARDRLGNSTRQSWQFNVATQTAMYETAVLPLAVTSHSNSALIGPGVTEVRGRTSPNAIVDVKVQGVTSMFGMFGVTQNLLTQSLQADANGNFAFTFQPHSSSRDARYEVALTATKNGVSTAQNLTLLQRGS